MLEKVIEKVRALNEPNPCRLEAKYKPHTHTSDEVFMGDIGEWEGESLTDTLGAIVVMIEGKADVNHDHDMDEIEGLQVALNHKANISHGHDEISSPEGEARVYFEDGDVRISGKDLVIDLSDSEGEDIVRITESDLINIARAKRNPDETPTTNSDNLVTSGGVAAALDGKLDSSISYDAVRAVYDVNELPVGHLILINQSDALVKKKLSQMIVQTELSLDQIHFHLNSGDLTNNFFLVRRFTYVIGFVTHHFIEVVGAWD